MNVIVIHTVNTRMHMNPSVAPLHAPYHECLYAKFHPIRFILELFRCSGTNTAGYLVSLSKPTT